MKLWLVRHAQPLVEAGICYGASDVAADAGATRQAAAALHARLPPAVQVRVSPRLRCLQLARALQVLRPQLAFAVDGRLAEMDFGAWEGQRWDALGPAALARWTADFAHHRCGGAESVAALMARVACAWEDARAAGGDVLWITHAGVIRAAMLLDRGVALPQAASDWPAGGPAFGELACLAPGAFRRNP